MRLLAIDPGVVTGYCIANYDKSERTLTIEDCGHLEGFNDAIAFIKAIQARDDIDKVVVEDFTLWANMATEVAHNDPKLVTVRVIGALMFALGEAINFQDANMQNKFFKRIAKELGYSVRGRHATSALVHIVSYLIHRNKNALRKAAKDT